MNMDAQVTRGENFLAWIRQNMRRGVDGDDTFWEVISVARALERDMYNHMSNASVAATSLATDMQRLTERLGNDQSDFNSLGEVQSKGNALDLALGKSWASRRAFARIVPLLDHVAKQTSWPLR